MGDSPKFSIVTPVYNPPRDAFERCIQSVVQQTYGDWEWCLVDDCSTAPWVRERLAELQATEPRIRVGYRTVNGGIVAASNDALSLARGEFVALLDNDDELHTDALTEVHKVISVDALIDFVYTDEDKINDEGMHYDRFRKPRWSPERFLAQNYCSHLSVVRRSLINEVGRFRQGFDGSQDYDLFLRVVERARKIAHIPKVLYHWRAVVGSTALSQSEKPYAFVAAMRAVERALERRGVEASVEETGPYPFQKVLRRLRRHPKVSIIIPTCGTYKTVFDENVCLVVEAVNSILQQTNYPNYEVVVVIDAESTEGSWAGLRAIADERVRLVRYDLPFNFAAKCNFGATISDGDYLLMLNDDTKVTDPDWLTVLAGYLEEPDVAMVGPLLILEDGSIQSAGHYNNPTPHNFRNGSSADSPGEFGILAIARECEGITGACALIRRAAYDEVGGMSLVFPRAFNDVDLCYKLIDAGYRIIWTPHTRLYHFETASRPQDLESSEVQLLSARWQRRFGADELCRL